MPWLSESFDVIPWIESWNKENSAQQLLPPKDLYREPLYPFINGDGFRALADIIACEELSDNFKGGCRSDYTIWSEVAVALPKFRKAVIVYVKVDYVGKFYLEHWKYIVASGLRVVLVTHNGDYSVPVDSRSHDSHFALKLLDDQNLVAWFGQNPSIIHPKLIPIPIGVENRMWHGNMSSLAAARREAFLAEKKNLAKPKWLLANFGVVTDASRAPLLERIKGWGMSDSITTGIKNSLKFYSDVASHRFVLAPRGNGLDTHRLWETLYAGRVPVVLSSSMDAAYKGLPVAVINSWDELTLAGIKLKWEEFFSTDQSKRKVKNLTPSRLYFASWACNIEVVASTGSLKEMEHAQNTSNLSEIAQYNKGEQGGVRRFDDCVIPFDGRGLKELRQFKYPLEYPLDK